MVRLTSKKFNSQEANDTLASSGTPKVPQKQKASAGAGHRARCKRYREENRREKSKLRRLIKHCRKQGADGDVVRALVKIRTQLPLHVFKEVGKAAGVDAEYIIGNYDGPKVLEKKAKTKAKSGGRKRAG